jgi:thiosulfate/3-mercaptopyruvate sulfurtransferase
MLHKDLVSASHLARLLSVGHCVVVDCRFDLGSPQKGLQDYLGGHIPGAFHANLDTDLAAAITPQSGRHPLPDAAAFAEFLSRTGWDSSKLLVAYDGCTNAMAARLWWLMEYFGQPAALLDGGLTAWVKAGLPLHRGAVEVQPAAPPALIAQAHRVVSVTEVFDSLDGNGLTLVDARSPDRYAGETEPLDSRAGHIPGAINRPLGLNLDEHGHFKPAAQLRAEFAAQLGNRQPETVVHYCGSGVTACHNYFAMQVAGLGATRVYPGSWSEWVREDSRPVETGRS